MSTIIVVFATLVAVGVAAQAHRMHRAVVELEDAVDKYIADGRKRRAEKGTP